jgi:hypothetical protein
MDEKLQSMLGQPGAHEHHLLHRFAHIKEVSPALAAMANSLPVGDRLLERLRVAANRPVAVGA